MRVQGSRVAIVGGSIAGCTAAHALVRAGCHVTIFERSKGALQNRGVGLGIPIPQRDELRRRGYVPPQYTTLEMKRRWCIVADGTKSGRMLWDQPTSVATNNWGILWGALRSSLQGVDYRDGISVVSFEDTGSGFELALSDGSSKSADILVGADGYHSIVRSFLHPDSSLKYAGYVIWRGSYPEARVKDRSFLDHMDATGGWPNVFYPIGNGGVHLMEDFEGGLTKGQRRVALLVYSPEPPGLEFTDGKTLAPGELKAGHYGYFLRLLDDYFPPEIAEVARGLQIQETFIQPICDQAIPSYAGDRLFLIGDAGSITRPHTASGATKAIDDALTLEQIVTEYDDWNEVLSRYDAERASAANSLVDLGRRLGAGQVTDCPDWASMGDGDFESWWAQLMEASSLYMYPVADS